VLQHVRSFEFSVAPEAIPKPPPSCASDHHPTEFLKSLVLPAVQRVSLRGVDFPPTFMPVFSKDLRELTLERTTFPDPHQLPLLFCLMPWLTTLNIVNPRVVEKGASITEQCICELHSRSSPPLLRKLSSFTLANIAEARLDMQTLVDMIISRIEGEHHSEGIVRLLPRHLRLAKLKSCSPRWGSSPRSWLLTSADPFG
jgi:hypothetical protein